ncbi:dedicator of cytokinesis 3, partial [Reticulomyxa filosa]
MVLKHILLPQKSNIRDYGYPCWSEIKKAAAMLGIDSETKLAEEDPEIALQKESGVLVPKELEDGEIEKFTIEQLISFHSDAKVMSVGNASLFGDDEKSEYLGRGDEPIFQLVFDIKHCIFSARNNTTLLFSIFDDSRKSFLTEEYCLTLTEKNFPTVGAPEDCKVLFRDLKQEDIEKDLYIVCKIYRFGPMEAPDEKNKKKKVSMKDVIRPYGITVIPLREQFPKLLRSIGTEANFEPGTAQIWCPKEEAYFVQLPFDLIEKKKNAPCTIAPMSIGIAHSLTLYQGQHEDLQKSYSAYDKLTHVHPLEVNPQTHSERHELYVTLLDMHVNQRSKRSACNVMCKVSLRNEQYEPLVGVVMMGRGGMAQPENEHESPVYYHTNDPTLSQTYVIAVPSSIKEMEKCHLYLSFWHTPGTSKKMEERGFAFLPLYDPKLRQMKTNKNYLLELYRMDKAPTGYLNNPNLKAEGKQAQIIYKMCSTKVLPDNDIHTFMTWEDQDPKTLASAIQRVQRKTFGELMQVLDEFMKVVFSIMSTLHKDPGMVEQSFFALVGVLGEVNKGVNIRFKNRIEEWIQNRFEYPGLWKVLADQILKLLKWIASEDAKKAETKDASPDLSKQGAEIARQLTKSMRGIQYLFLLMKRSVDLEIQNEKEAKLRIQTEYDNKINAIFDSLNRVMGLTEPRTVTGVQKSQDLTKRTVKFVESAQNTGVVNSVEKLLLMLRILENPKFNRKDIVELFLPCVAKQLTFHMSQSIDEQIACAIIIEKCVAYLDPKRPRTLKSIERNAVRVVHDGKGCEPREELLHQFTHLFLVFFGALDNIRKVDMSEVSNAQRIFGKTVDKNPAKRQRGMSVPSVESIASDQIVVHRSFLVTIAELSRLLTGGTAKSDTFAEKSDRVDIVIREERAKSDINAAKLIEGVLKCCKNLLEESLFPRSWVFMRMVEAEVGLRAFSWFGSTLRTNYMDTSFNKELWDSWLALGMLFLSHRDFAIEDMIKQRADIVRDAYGDIRTTAINQLRTAWDVLKSHRSELAETMVTAAIAASASEMQQIQEFAEDVYFQMMKSEFETTNSMKNVETHTIDQVDSLTEDYGNDEKIINRYLDFFRKRVSAKLANSNTKLKKIGEQFIGEIERLYEYLVQLRKLPNDAVHEDERTSATLKLLNYLDKGGKVDMYNRYIHKLSLMHAQLGNHIESGQCHVKHASRLGWSDRVLRAEPHFSLDEQPEWRRHVQLLENAYQQFQIGEAWEMAVRVCQELSHALSAQLEKESQCWKFISQCDRVFQTHFLLSFRGDFPDELRESVMDFTNRIKAKWKDAKVVNSSDPVPAENESPDFKGQYIRVAKLNPSSPEEMDGGDFKWEKTK